MTSKPTPQPAVLLMLSTPRVVAVGMAAGGRIARTEETADGRLTFFLDGLPADFLTRLANDEITVSGRAVVNHMESVLSMIADRQRGRRR